MHTILDERRHGDPDVPPLDRETTLGHLTSRMTRLLCFTEDYRAPLHKENSVLVSCIQQAIAVLFPSDVRHKPPPDAGSLEWWSKMRNILNSFAV
jgi:hypothetical protein